MASVDGGDEPRPKLPRLATRYVDPAFLAPPVPNPSYVDPRADAADNLDDDVLHAELCAYVVPRTISKPRLDVADRDGSLSLAKSSSTQALRDFSATRRVKEDRKAAQIREYKRRQSKKRIQENQAKRRIRGSIKASRDDDDDGAAPKKPRGRKGGGYSKTLFSKLSKGKGFQVPKLLPK